MRLIDADKMLAELLMINERSNIFAAPFARRIKRFIDRQPTIEARKHGHWEPFININREKTYRCSTCQNEAPHDLYGYFELTNYCPHCGTVMDEEASKNG